MSNEISRAYREASVQVRTTAEKHGVALSGRDVDKVVRSYGLERQPANVSGERIVRAHDSLNRLNTEKDSGELLVRCQKQASVSGRSSISRTTADDIDRLQRFSRMYNRKELTAVEAEAILRSHHDLLSQPSSKISSAIVNYRSAQAFKTGSKAFLRTATLAAGMARAANSDEGSGFDSQGVAAQGYDFLRKQRTGQWKKVALEKARLEAKEQAALEASAKSTGRTAARTSPRQHSAPTNSARGASRVTKTRASFSKNVAKKQSHVMTSAERSYKLRRGNAVSRLVGKKKAKEAAGKAAKESAKTTLEKWSEGASATSAIRLALIAFAGMGIVAVIVAVVCAALTIFMGVAMSQRYNLIGDWYDSNLYKTDNFVAITQDLQKKYYDDCLALAYEVGADTPKPSDVTINWKEVYSLWSVIVRYRADNAQMSISCDDGYGNLVTGYEKNSPVFNLTSANAPMFSQDDDYLQDFYLAFYSMYYDLKAVDGRGNPILVKLSTGTRYTPYYPEKSGGTGYDYSMFSATNGWPLINTKTNEVVQDVLEKNPETGAWSIKNSAYKFIYATDHVGEEEGCFVRGKPKVTVSVKSKTDTFEYPAAQASVYLKIKWTGYSGPTSNTRLNFWGSNTRGEWELAEIRCLSNDGNWHNITKDSEEWVYIRDHNATSVIIPSKTCGACGHGPHSHYTETEKGTTKDLWYTKDPVKVSYKDAVLNYPNPTAVDGLDVLHEVYHKVFCDGYYFATHYGPFNLGLSRTVSGDTVIEAGTSYFDTHEGILVVLDQIFDRTKYYPWGTSTQYLRGGVGLPGDGSGSHDYYDNIKKSLNLIRSSQSADYPSSLPANNYLVASFDTSGTKINTYAVNNSDPAKKQWTNMIEMIYASISEVQRCFPFSVHYRPCTGLGEYNAGSPWEYGRLSGSVSDCDCWDVLNFTWGPVQANWNSTTYLLYRYFMAEQSMCPSAVCGILGALQYETGFDVSGYGTVPPIDNNGAYALGLLQWNQGIKPEKNNTNLYDNRLCSWCAEHNMNWRNAGAQLQYLSDCCANGDSAGTGNYPSGVYACQMLNHTYNGSFPADRQIVADSAYTNSTGNPTFSAADLAGAYESCYFWGRLVERGVEQIGGTYWDDWVRPGYGDEDRIFDLEPFIAHKKGNESVHRYEYYSDSNPYWSGLNCDKQRMAAAHVFLRYVAASDPNYYSVAYYDGDF